MVEEPKVKAAAAVFVQGLPAIPPHRHLLHARPRYLGVDALRPAHEHDRQPNMKWGAATATALHEEHIVHYAVLHEESMENILPTLWRNNDAQEKCTERVKNVVHKLSAPAARGTYDSDSK